MNKTKLGNNKRGARLQGILHGRKARELDEKLRLVTFRPRRQLFRDGSSSSVSKFSCLSWLSCPSIE
jgi:hypothetical protein